MESVITGSVVEKATESLIDQIWHQVLYLFSYKENIENLKKGLDELDGKTVRVKESVEEAKRNVKKIYEDVQKWLKQVEEVKEEVNKVLEGNAQMTCFYCRCPIIKSMYSLSRKAIKLSSEIQTLIGKSKFDEVGYRASNVQTSYLSPQDLEKFESRSLTKEKVLEILEDPKIGIIGLCGMAGVGKTKLAMEIKNIVKVKKLFDEAAFATVSQIPDFNKICGEIAAGLRLNISDIRDFPHETTTRISDRLVKDDKKILIILDDIWADLDLASLGIPIKNGRKGLKVMLTSRYREVCDRMGAQRIIEVEVLKEREAWLLFKEISGISDDDDNDLKDIAKEVAKECGGLPLAIICIGGILKNKKANLYVWKDVLRQLKKSNVAIIRGEKNLVFTRIELSYESLRDKDYKSLLLLCSLFSEDYEIPIETLVRYVKGLEMFDPDMRFNEMRDKVGTIVDYLKDCYLLLSSTRERSVKLHDVVRDVCLSIMADTGKGQGLMSRKYVCHEILPNISVEGMKDVRVLDLELCGWQWLTSSLQCSLTSLRTLCLQQCDLRAKDLSFIGCLKMLEVLSFYKSILPSFPKEVAQLTNLMLLDLRFKENHPFPLGTFLGLKKLEELYMGYYEIEKKEVADHTWITEAYLFSHLTTLQVRVEMDILLQILKGLDLRKLEKFHISNKDLHRIYKSPAPYEVVQRSLELIVASNALKVNKLERNVVLELVKKLGLNNLRELELIYSPNLKYFIDANDVQVIQMDVLRNLESLRVSYCKKLKGLCRGRIQSILKCLVHLKDLDISHCSSLEVVVCMEENTDEQVIEFPSLKSLKLSKLKKFKGFCFGHESQPLLDKVSFPALEILDVSFINNCPQWLIGFHMPSGSLHNLTRIDIIGCNGLKYLFPHTPSMANMFASLEEISIHYCNSMEYFIGGEVTKDAADVNIKEFLFPKLRSIYLNNLVNLKSFSKGEDYELILPSLTELKIWECPQLNIFSYGKLSAPRLQ